MTKIMISWFFDFPSVFPTHIQSHVTWTHCRYPRRVHTSWYPWCESASEPWHVYASSSYRGITSLRSKSVTHRSEELTIIATGAWEVSVSLTGPIPKRSDLRHPQSLDETTRQPQDEVTVVETQSSILLVPPRGQLELLLYVAHSSSNLPKL